MTSASHAEGRQFDPGWVYVSRIGIDRGSILVFAFFFASCWDSRDDVPGISAMGTSFQMGCEGCCWLLFSFFTCDNDAARAEDCSEQFCQCCCGPFSRWCDWLEVRSCQKRKREATSCNLLHNHHVFWALQSHPWSSGYDVSLTR